MSVALSALLGSDFTADPANLMSYTWHPEHIFLSYLISVQSSYVALDLLQLRVHRVMALLSAACVACGTIWAMHFIGMAAAEVDAYPELGAGWQTASVIFAFVPIAIAFQLLWDKVDVPDTKDISLLANWHAFLDAPHGWMVLSGTLIATGVCAMHYTGMLGLQFFSNGPQVMAVYGVPLGGRVYAQYKIEWGILAASVCIALFAANAALYFAFVFPLTRRFAFPTAIVMGVAVCAMHYTGMFAMRPYLPRELREIDPAESTVSLLFVIGGLTAMNTTLLVIGSVVRINRLNKLAEEAHDITVGHFSMYVPRAVIQDLLASADGEMTMTSSMDTSTLVIIFIDIANFTQFAESVDVTTLVHLLSEYFEQATKTLMSHGCTIDKYIGDAVMGFWGAPLPHPTPEYSACCGALHLLSVIRSLKPAFRQYNHDLRIRVGMHRGVCNVGNIGCQERLTYTALGDPVNVASRLEGANKKYGTSVMISEDLAGEVSDKIFAMRALGHVRVAGKAKPQRVYQLCGAYKHPSAVTAAELLHTTGNDSAVDLGAVDLEANIATDEELPPVNIELHDADNKSATSIHSSNTKEVQRSRRHSLGTARSANSKYTAATSSRTRNSRASGKSSAKMKKVMDYTVLQEYRTVAALYDLGEEEEQYINDLNGAIYAVEDRGDDTVLKEFLRELTAPHSVKLCEKLSINRALTIETLQEWITEHKHSEADDANE